MLRTQMTVEKPINHGCLSDTHAVTIKSLTRDKQTVCRQYYVTKGQVLLASLALVLMLFTIEFHFRLMALNTGMAWNNLPFALHKSITVITWFINDLAWFQPLWYSAVLCVTLLMLIGEIDDNILPLESVLLLAGIVGNLYSSLRYGGVIDYIPVPIGQIVFYTNLSDIYVIAGLVTCGCWCVYKQCCE